MFKKNITLSLLLFFNTVTPTNIISDVYNTVRETIEFLKLKAARLKTEIEVRKFFHNIYFENLKKAVENQEENKITYLANKVSSLGIEIVELKNKLEQTLEKIKNSNN